MKVLVTGGLGFIGSHTVVKLIEAGHEVVIVDNLFNSKLDVADRIEQITHAKPKVFIQDVCDKEKLADIFRQVLPDAVIHFAGYKAVGESCQKPLMYYRNNIDSALSVLECMQEFGCKNLVFLRLLLYMGSLAVCLLQKLVLDKRQLILMGRQR